MGALGYIDQISPLFPEVRCHQDNLQPRSGAMMTMYFSRALRRTKTPPEYLGWPVIQSKHSIRHRKIRKCQPTEAWLFFYIFLFRSQINSSSNTSAMYRTLLLLSANGEITESSMGWAAQRCSYPVANLLGSPDLRGTPFLLSWYMPYFTLAAFPSTKVQPLLVSLGGSIYPSVFCMSFPFLRPGC